MALLSVALAYAIKTPPQDGFQISGAEHAFKVTHALGIAASISGVTLVAAWLRHTWGDLGVLTTSVLVGLVELHSAVVSVAQLGSTDSVQSPLARWGVMAVLAASAAAKIGLAYFSGGKSYGHRVTTGFAALGVAAMAGMSMAP